LINRQVLTSIYQVMLNNLHNLVVSCYSTVNAELNYWQIFVTKIKLNSEKVGFPFLELELHLSRGQTQQF